MLLLFASFIILIHVLILIYLYGLEDETCKCIRDWRHTTIKVLCFLIVILQKTLKV